METRVPSPRFVAPQLHRAEHRSGMFWCGPEVPPALHGRRRGQLPVEFLIQRRRARHCQLRSRVLHQVPR